MHFWDDEYAILCPIQLFIFLHFNDSSYQIKILRRDRYSRRFLPTTNETTLPLAFHKQKLKDSS